MSRRAEIGVRVALGASRAGILAMVLRDVGKMMLVGLTAGSIFALVAARGVSALLFGVEPHDPATLASAAAALAVAGLLAAVSPARRATKVDPVSVLRDV